MNTGEGVKVNLTTQELATLLEGLATEARAELNQTKFVREAIRHVDKAVNILKTGEELNQAIVKDELSIQCVVPEVPDRFKPRIPIDEGLAFIAERVEATDKHIASLEPKVIAALDKILEKILPKKYFEDPPEECVIVLCDGLLPFYVGMTTNLISYMRGLITMCLKDPSPRFYSTFKALDAGTMNVQVIEPDQFITLSTLKAKTLAGYQARGYCLFNK